MRRSCICAPVIAIKHFFQLLFFYPFAVVLNCHMSSFFLFKPYNDLHIRIIVNEGI
ncbi:hypothetical protein SSPIM334S_08521 [Streptomyces spiroverticillatus]